jgi:multicomponent Na+:H+ antiporter subunit G
VIAEWLTAFFLVAGSAFLLLAGASLARMPDLYTRISSSSKAVTAGAGACFIAAAWFFTDTSVATRAMAGLAFFVLTSPVAAHVVARAATYLDVPFTERTVLPEPTEEAPEPLKNSR